MFGVIGGAERGKFVTGRLAGEGGDVVEKVHRMTVDRSVGPGEPVTHGARVRDVAADETGAPAQSGFVSGHLAVTDDDQPGVDARVQGAVGDDRSESIAGGRHLGGDPEMFEDRGGTHALEFGTDGVFVPPSGAHVDFDGVGVGPFVVPRPGHPGEEGVDGGHVGVTEVDERCLGGVDDVLDAVGTRVDRRAVGLGDPVVGDRDLGTG